MLWMPGKRSICNKFIGTAPPLVCIDENLLFFSNVVEHMDTMKQYHDIGLIRINLDSLITSVRAHAIEWKVTLGEILIDETKTILQQLANHIIVSLRIDRRTESRLETTFTLYKFFLVRPGFEIRSAYKHKRI